MRPAAAAAAGCSGGMATKLDAAGIATSEGIAVLVAARTTWAGRSPARTSARSSRRPGAGPRHGCSGCATPPPAGRPGARRGRGHGGRRRRASLLPAGVTGVGGDFNAGEPVELVGPDEGPVARGWSPTTPLSCPLCSAARPGSSMPITGARWSIATTSCCSEPDAPLAAVPGWHPRCVTLDLSVPKGHWTDRRTRSGEEQTSWLLVSGRPASTATWW